MRSFTFALATLAISTVQFASGAPAPWGGAEQKSSDITETGNAYSGTAGSADGGSAGNPGAQYFPLLGLSSLPLVRVASGNGGRGGQANSGLAATRHSRKVHEHEHEHEHQQSQNSNTLTQNSFSGAAGKASGGSAAGPPATVDAFSGNGGDGGGASSGDSLSGIASPQELEVVNLLGGSWT